MWWYTWRHTKPSYPCSCAQLTVFSAVFTSQIISIHVKCHQTVCASFLAVWCFTQSFHALQPLLSRRDIMCSLCFYSKCLWRHSLWLTPPTLPAQPENTTHTYTHTIQHCQKLLHLGTGEIKPSWIWAMRISHSILAHTLSWLEEITNIWSFHYILECMYLITIHNSAMNMCTWSKHIHTVYYCFKLTGVCFQYSVNIFSRQAA